MRWPWQKRVEPKKSAPTPRRNDFRVARRTWEAAKSSPFALGWMAGSSHIDQILRNALTALRARSRNEVMNNAYAIRFVTLAVSNVVGPEGVTVRSAVKRRDNPNQLDTLANEALNDAWEEWKSRYCDVKGIMTFEMFQRLAISTLVTDGEFLVRLHLDSGPHGLQLEMIDPERLDVTYHGIKAPNGNLVRLGVEYDSVGRPTAYYINDVSDQGTYLPGTRRRVVAEQMIHCFIPQWVDQNRGVPWFSTALLRMKMVDGYEEGAIVNARAGANKLGFYVSPDGSAYQGEDAEAGDGSLKQTVDPGEFEQLPTGVSVEKYDPTYPHEMFDDFMKRVLRGIASGLNVSYNALANDLDGVSYSSLRGALLEDREIWKMLQNWFIGMFITRVRELWVSNAVLRGQVRINGVTRLAGAPSDYVRTVYRGRRWEWVDPQKDMVANEKGINNRVMSRSEIIRRQGLDPTEVFTEIAAEERLMDDLGIDYSTPPADGGAETSAEGDNEQEQTAAA